MADRICKTLKTIQRLLPCKVSPACKTSSVIFDLDVVEELLNLNIFVWLRALFGGNLWHLHSNKVKQSPLEDRWLNARCLTNCPQNLFFIESKCIWFIERVVAQNFCQWRLLLFSCHTYPRAMCELMLIQGETLFLAQRADLSKTCLFEN